MPSSASRSPGLALLRCTIAGGALLLAPAATAPGRREQRHAHLLAVGQQNGEIDRLEIGALARTARAAHGVAGAAAGRQPVDAGVS